MPEWKILSNAEKENVLNMISTRWDCKIAEFDYAVLRTPKDKLYIVSPNVLEADLSGLRIDKLGIYLGEIMKSTVRLSIEGAQLIGPLAKANVFEIEKKDARKWLAGHDFDVPEDMRGFMIVKCEDDFLGCGNAVGGRLLNYVSKSRRLGASK